MVSRPGSRSATRRGGLAAGAALLTGGLLLGISACGNSDAPDVAVSPTVLVNVPDDSAIPGTTSIDPTVTVGTAVSVVVSDTYDPTFDVNQKQIEALQTDGPYDPLVNARAAIAAARGDARVNRKLVLLAFGTNLCPDCIVLNELFSASEVSELLTRSFIKVYVDLGQFDRNMDIAAEYGDIAANGIPVLAVIDADGNILGDTRRGEFARARSLTPALVAQFLSRFA